MSNEREERSPAYIIPKNYEDSFITSGGISFRSIGEGAILAALTIPVFIFLPMRLLYRAILIAVFGGGLFAFGVIGVKHCYLSEFIVKFFKFKGSSHEMKRNDDSVFDDLLVKAQSAFETADDSTAENKEVFDGGDKDEDNDELKIKENEKYKKKRAKKEK